MYERNVDISNIRVSNTLIWRTTNRARRKSIEKEWVHGSKLIEWSSHISLLWEIPFTILVEIHRRFIRFNGEKSSVRPWSWTDDFSSRKRFRVTFSRFSGEQLVSERVVALSRSAATRSECFSSSRTQTNRGNHRVINLRIIK